MADMTFSANLLPSSDLGNNLGNDDQKWNIYGNIIGLVDLVYPVGSIYMSVNSISPATLFGGIWEQLENTFLLGAGSSYTAGSTGGSASSAHTHTLSHTHSVTTAGSVGYHTLTISEIPSHNHSFGMMSDASYHDNWSPSRGSNAPYGNYGSTNYTGGNGAHNHGFTGSTVTSGGASTATTSGASDTNNMPPYLVVYIWKRTA